jgi:PAS domain S-box-containing protein
LPEVVSHSERFNLLVSRLGDFVVVLLDQQGCFMSWHPGVEKQFGYTAEEFIGQPGEILLPLPDRLKGSFRRELEIAKREGRAFAPNPDV